MNKNRRAERNRSPGIEAAPWMLTFTDLLFLVLTLSVMRFSMLSFPRSDQPWSGGSPLAASHPAYGLLRAIEEEVGQALRSGPAIERSDGMVRFSPGVDISWAEVSIHLSLDTDFVGAEPSAFPFQTSALLRNVAKLARSRGYFIDVQVRAPGEELPYFQAAEAIRQLIDTGIDPELLAAGVFYPKPGSETVLRLSFTPNSALLPAPKNRDGA